MYQFAVIGNPIQHSLSPRIHQAFAKQMSMDISYEKVYAPLNGFNTTVDTLRNKGINGANVTIPFKQQAFKYADICTKRAIAANAVNTLIFKDNQCVGDNTDGVGLLRDLENKQIILKNKRILILGAGGAARGIIPVLKRQYPKKIYILNRTEDAAKQLADEFTCEVIQSNTQVDLIINTTNADFQATTTFDVIKSLLNTDCYDLNYADRHHTFANWATAKNAKFCHDGLGMLIEQAAESFFLWTGYRPKTCNFVYGRKVLRPYR